MNIKESFSKLKSVSKTKILNIVWRFWVRSFKFILWIFAIASFVYVGFVWYENFLTLEKKGADKEVEIELRRNKVQFKEQDFDSLVDSLDKRALLFDQSKSPSQDIFFPDQKPATLDAVSDEEVVESDKVDESADPVTGEEPVSLDPESANEEVLESPFDRGSSQEGEQQEGEQKESEQQRDEQQDVTGSEATLPVEDKEKMTGDEAGQGGIVTDNES